MEKISISLSHSGIKILGNIFRDFFSASLLLTRHSSIVENLGVGE